MSRFAVLAVLALAAVANAQVCSNSYGDANCATITNLCEGARSWMQTNCARACNYCVTTPVFNNACSDLNVGCPQWKASCSLPQTQAWMTVNCPATCSICNTATGTATCTNIEPTSVCTANAALCAAGTWSTWMKTNCALTCSSCTSVSVASSSCTDSDSRCPSWVNFCNDAQYTAWMKPNCALTCNQCGAASCNNVETDVSCDSAKASGYCTNTAWAAWMSTNCKKSCGCNTATAAPQAACEDSDTKCAGWSAYCTTAAYSDYMSTSCKKTCGKCTAATDSVGACTFTQKTKHQILGYADDDSKNYITLAQAKAKCVEYGTKCCGVTVHYTAPATFQVGACRGNTTDTAEILAKADADAYLKECACSDVEPANTCQSYQGLCVSGDYVEWMKTNCKKSCGLCPNATAVTAAPTAAPTPAPTAAPTNAPVWANSYACTASADDTSEFNIKLPYVAANGVETISTAALVAMVNGNTAGVAEYKAVDKAACQAKCTAIAGCKAFVYLGAAVAQPWNTVCKLKSVFNTNTPSATVPPVYIKTGGDYCKRS